MRNSTYFVVEAIGHKGGKYSKKASSLDKAITLANFSIRFDNPWRIRIRDAFGTIMLDDGDLRSK